MVSGLPYDPMLRVSHDRPCPVCEKHDWCLVAADGSAAMCARVQEGSVKKAGEAGWLHIIDPNVARPAKQQSFPQPARKPLRNWSNQLARYESERGSALDQLSVQLGVSRESLERIHTGYDSFKKWWTFPERDADGKVIGILRRDHSGEKKRLAGSRCGLCYPFDWKQTPGPILLVEGPSDTATVLTMGLCGIGRPSNNSGADLLIGLLETVPLDRAIIVIGERDQKSNGTWPGRSGAISTASQIAESLERAIAWSMPPDDAKDTRAWLQSIPQTLPIARVADLFLSGLNMNWVHPIPVITCPEPTGPAVPLTDWRDAMVAIRLASLSSAGCYLDASPTGSGKSHADLQTLLHRKVT